MHADYTYPVCMSTECAQPLRTEGCETITLMREEHERAIGDAAEQYQRAADAKEQASANLAAAMRAAYGDGEQQTAILRAARHVWSREYLRVILGLTKRKGGEG